MSDALDTAAKPIKKPKRVLPERYKAYRGVWVFIEHEHGQVHPVSWELLGEGRKLADKLGVTRSAISQWPDDAPIPMPRQWQLKAMHPDIFGDQRPDQQKAA